MPKAFDPALLGGLQLPLDRNPLQRISYQPPKVEFDLTALIEDVKRYVTELLFPAIEELTGVDLSAFLPIINTVVDSLTTLFGDLNPSSGTFNPLDAITTFINLMVEVGANLPMALITELTGFTGGVPILSQLIGLFTGTTGGLTGLSGLGSIFGDLTGLLGNPTALGSGTPILGAAGSIPLLGPLIEEFVSLLGGVGAGSGLGGLTTIFDDLLGVLGNPTGLGSGTPGIGSLGSIPLLGPVFGLFGGASDATQAGNFFTNLLSFLGTPTLTGSTGTFDPTAAATSFINDILNPTGLLTSVTAIVEALTGSSGDLTDLTAWATDIPILGDLVEAITGSAGGLTDLSSFFAALPFLDDIVEAITGTTGGDLPDLASFFTGFAGGGSLLDQLVGSITGSAGGLTDLTGFFTSFFGIFGGASNLGQAGNFFTNLLSMLNTPALTGSPGSFNPSTALSSMITGLINPLGLLAPLSGGTVPTGNIPALPNSLVPGLGSLFSTIFNGLTGQGLLGVTEAEAGDQVAELAGTVTSLGAAVSNLISANDQSTFSGRRGVDDLERTAATDLGGSSFWNQSYSGGTSGSWAIADGHNAKWVPGSGVRTMKAIRPATADDATTLTDYQKVGMTIGAQTISGSDSNVENSILLRASADGSTYVRAKVKNNQAQFFYANGGAETALGSSVSTTHAAGVNFYGIAGTAGNIRTFQLVRGTSPILTVTDNTSVTALGVSNRGWGHTVTANGSKVPSSASQFTVADNTPAAVVGTTMRVYRGTTSGITKSSGASAMPANTFDTVDYISADMAWNAATSTLTVTKAGTYLFSGRFEMSNPIGFSEEIYPTVYVNGTLRARGGARRGITAAAFGVPHFPQDLSAGGDAMLLYCQAGATLQLGFFATASNTVIGDAAGHKTWFAATKIG